jgi:hypothetical protein
MGGRAYFMNKGLVARGTAYRRVGIEPEGRHSHYRSGENALWLDK